MKTSTIVSLVALAIRAGAAPLDLSSGKLSLQLNIDLNQAGFGGNNDLFHFTSTHFIHAVPELVVNGTTPTGGLAGASGLFNFGINSHANMICYNITLHNFQGEFSSPASSATHIHEAAVGASGPPRISFPNPKRFNDDPAVLNSAGCLTGPFTTGLVMEGKDTGEGFHISQIEQNPAAFFADTHSSLALPGAVRGQIA